MYTVYCIYIIYILYPLLKRTVSNGIGRIPSYKKGSSGSPWKMKSHEAIRFDGNQKFGQLISWGWYVYPIFLYQKRRVCEFHHPTSIWNPVKNRDKLYHLHLVMAGFLVAINRFTVRWIHIGSLHHQLQPKPSPPWGILPLKTWWLSNLGICWNPKRCHFFRNPISNRVRVAYITLRFEASFPF